MRKLARLVLVLLALVAYAAPVEALFASQPCACCRNGQCCRRTHGSGWTSRGTCAGTCTCLFAPGAGPVTFARPAYPAALAVAREKRSEPQPVRAASTRPAPLYQRPPPSC